MIREINSTFQTNNIVARYNNCLFNEQMPRHCNKSSCNTSSTTNGAQVDGAFLFLAQHLPVKVVYKRLLILPWPSKVKTKMISQEKITAKGSSGNKGRNKSCVICSTTLSHSFLKWMVAVITNTLYASIYISIVI